MTTPADKQDSSRPRLNLVVGAIALSIVLPGVLALGIFLSMRFNHYDIWPWVYFGGPVSVLFIAFVIRLFRWCGWKHVLLCLIPSLGIALFVFTIIFGISFDAPEMHIALGVVAGIIVGPGMLGVGVASWVGRYANTEKRRWVAVLVASAVIASLPAVQWIGWRAYACYSSAHAETVGKAHLRSTAQELKQTDIVSTLDAPISKGRNLLWCATFQVAWNEFCTQAGEDIRMEREDPSVALLNRKAVKKEYLDAETYIVRTGSADHGGLDTISADLNDKFKGAASPTLLPSANSLPPGSFFAYAYMCANLPFEWAFERHDAPLDFCGTPVEAFGIEQYLKSQEKERLAATQLFIYYTEKKQGVIIELKTRRTEHHLYLALVPPLATLGETARDVLSRVKGVEPSSLPEWSDLIVPVIDFDLTRDYAELTGRPLHVRKFNGQPIGMATQQIRFKLDERGAVLKSEALIAVLGSSELAFNQPFLVLLQYQDNELPYFAAWIDNPELLIRK